MEEIATRLFCSAIARRPSSYTPPSEDSPPPSAYCRNKKAYSSSILRRDGSLSPMTIFMPVLQSTAPPAQARRRLRRKIAGEFCRPPFADSREGSDCRQKCFECHPWPDKPYPQASAEGPQAAVGATGNRRRLHE